MKPETDLNNEENLRDENEFMKMKIMLEHGGTFGTIKDSDLPAEIENQFLKNIIEYEKQFVSDKMIKVFDKINRPSHFRPVHDIPVDEIENALKELRDYMDTFGIRLDVCSPDISPSEVYRFIVEELFEHEMQDINIPGMMNCFIYDEFYPDVKFENTNVAVDDCIQQVFEKEPFKWMLHFRKEGLRLNEHFPLTESEFMHFVNRFKEAYEQITLHEMDKPVCDIDGKKCLVKGKYNASVVLQKEEIMLQGKWSVESELDEDLDYWYIIDVQIEGIRF
jgi:hypothetical protein